MNKLLRTMLVLTMLIFMVAVNPINRVSADDIEKVRFEAEEAQLSDYISINKYTYASKGEATYFLKEGDAITFDDVPESKGLTICYANGGKQATQVSLYVNDTFIKNIPIPKTTGWGQFAANYKYYQTDIKIPNGAQIKFQKDDQTKGYFTIDYIEVDAVNFEGTYPIPEPDPVTSLLRLEAENAQLAGSAAPVASKKASDGNMVKIGILDIDSVTFKSRVKANGFTICYTAVALKTCDLDVYFDNVLVESIVLNKTTGSGYAEKDYWSYPVTRDVQVGTNIKLIINKTDKADKYNSVSIDYLELYTGSTKPTIEKPVALAGPAPNAIPTIDPKTGIMKIEAEYADSLFVVSFNPNVSNKKMVALSNYASKPMIFKNVPKANGISLIYSSTAALGSSVSIYINDVKAKTLILEGAEYQTTKYVFAPAHIKVNIPQGANIKIIKDLGRGKDDFQSTIIDYIDLYTGTTPAPETTKDWQPVPNLDANKANARKAIVAGMQKYDEEITIARYCITESALEEMRKDISIYTEPSLYHLKGLNIGQSNIRSFDVTSTVEVKNADGKKYKVVYTIKPNYNMAKKDYMINYPIYSKAINKMISNIPKEWSTADKIIAVNDYICLNTKYYSEGNDKTTTLGVYIFGKATCKGYALAFKDAMNRLDIESLYIAGNNNHHAWIMVKVDGEWYHADATFNDPTPDDSDRALHRNLLSSDAQFKAQKHYDWAGLIRIGTGITPPAASSTKYDNASWKSIDTKIDGPVEPLVK